MALKAKPDKVRKDALPKPPGAESHDKPVRDAREDPSPNPNPTIGKKRRSGVPEKQGHRAGRGSPARPRQMLPEFLSILDQGSRCRKR